MKYGPEADQENFETRRPDADRRGLRTWRTVDSCFRFWSIIKKLFYNIFRAFHPIFRQLLIVEKVIFKIKYFKIAFTISFNILRVKTRLCDVVPKSAKIN